MNESIRIPQTAREQLFHLPPRPVLEAITVQLHQKIFTLLDGKGLDILSSSFRTKTFESTLKKLNRKGWEYPIVDIHGLRFVASKLSINYSIVTICDNWEIPQTFPGEVPWLGIYSKEFGPSTNPKSHPEYEAVHLRLAIPNGARIAEIQFLTPEQMIVADQTRTYYEENLRRNLS